jgi:hypothetical protein
MVTVTTPIVFFSKSEPATTNVFHNESESLPQLVFLGGILTEKASSANIDVSTIYELACKSSQRVLWPRKVRPFSAKQNLAMGRYNFG